MGFDLSWDTLAILAVGIRIHYGGADPREIEAALSFFFTLLSLNGSNKRQLSFLNSGCSVMYLW